MKVVYIAHPIKGNVDLNIELVKAIVKKINLTQEDICPIAPYVDNGLDDTNPTLRARGIKNNIELLSRNFVDEMWLYGTAFSEGMQEEVKLAMQHRIKVICMESFIMPQVKEFVEAQLFIYPNANFNWFINTRTLQMTVDLNPPTKSLRTPEHFENMKKLWGNSSGEVIKKGSDIIFTVIFTKQDNTTIDIDIPAYDDLAACRKANYILAENNYKQYEFANGNPTTMGTL